MYLVGQKTNRDLIDNGKLDNSNFIIIKGPKNYGKTYLTKYIADHYKLNYVLLDNKVDTIRSLVKESNMNNNCLYHFKDFDKSSPAAKAALLKICEETPPGMKIVITTSAYNLLNTLISRAYCIDTQAYTIEELLEYINILEFDKEALRRLYEDYNLDLTPSFLLSLKNIDDSEMLDLVDMGLDIITKDRDLEHISSISNKFWNREIEYIKMYLNILKRAVLMHEGIDYRNCVKYVSILTNGIYSLDKIAISNFKIFMHNLFMELIS